MIWWCVFAALVAGYSNDRFGPRVTGLFGAVTGSAGFFLTYFCTGYVHLLLTFAVLVGMYRDQKDKRDMYISYWRLPF